MTNLEEKQDYRDFYKDVTSGTNKVFVKRAKRKLTYNETKDNHCWMHYIPLHRSSCQGCVTVSSKGMRYLWQLVNNEEKPLLLWSYYVE